MFAVRSELNNHPFTETSTLAITEGGYRFPVSVLLDASLTPRCENNQPFFVSDIIRASDTQWVWNIKDSYNTSVFNVVFKDDADSLLPSSDQGGFYVGYGIQDDMACGTILGTQELRAWLHTVPSLLNIDSTALAFTASAVRPVGVSEPRGNLLYEGNKVSSILWGDNITVNSSGEATIVLDTINTTQEYTPIRSLFINNIQLTGEDLYIIPKEGSKVRVLSESDIKVGKVSEL